MRHLLLVCGMFAAAVLLLSAPQVRADGIDTFTLNESLNGIDTTTLSWQLPAAGVPDLGLDGAGFAFYNVSTSEYLDGVLQTTIPNDTIVYLVGYGLYDSLQLGVFGSSTLPYSGLESAPVFYPRHVYRDGSDRPNYRLDANYQHPGAFCAPHAEHRFPGSRRRYRAQEDPGLSPPQSP
jgi:hypothetical protein